MKHKYKVGRKVTITKSDHQSIRIGEEGLIDCYHKDGYGIAFTKYWAPIVGHDVGVTEKRIIFFAEDDFK